MAGLKATLTPLRNKHGFLHGLVTLLAFVFCFLVGINTNSARPKVVFFLFTGGFTVAMGIIWLAFRFKACEDYCPQGFILFEMMYCILDSIFMLASWIILATESNQLKMIDSSLYGQILTATIFGVLMNVLLLIHAYILNNKRNKSAIAVLES